MLLNYFFFSFIYIRQIPPQKISIFKKNLEGLTYRSFKIIKEAIFTGRCNLTFH